MNGFKKLAGLVLALFITACSTGPTVALSGNLLKDVAVDAQRANELFIKYGDPAEVACATFFNGVIASVEQKNALVDMIKAESTSGALSKAAVTILIAQTLRQQGVDAAQSFQTGFQKNCSGVQAEVLSLIMTRGLSTLSNSPTPLPIAIKP